jgi:NitT/TauT family transport system substrate-binding protein
MRRRTLLATAVIGGARLALEGRPLSARTLEKTKVVLGVGGKPLLYYLPLTIAERKGFFKEQGIEVEINDFGGGAKSLQALVGGSVDVVTGAYEHTIRMQAKRQDIRAVVELGRFPGIVLAIKKGLEGKVKSPKDLVGMKVGVTAPGSSTNFFVNFLLANEGVTPDQVAFIGVGAGPTAVAAMKKGEIDAIANLDPVIAKLEQDGDVFVLADSRTEEGTRAIFGGSNPAAVLYTRGEFIEENPNTVQALVDAFLAALRWIEKASAEEIAGAVPEEYYLGDRSLYLAAVAKSKPTYSRSGVVPPEGMRNALDMLVRFDKELAEAKIDLSRTFDPRFVDRSGKG